MLATDEEDVTHNHWCWTWLNTCLSNPKEHHEVERKVSRPTVTANSIVMTAPIHPTSQYMMIPYDPQRDKHIQVRINNMFDIYFSNNANMIMITPYKSDQIQYTVTSTLEVQS